MTQREIIAKLKLIEIEQERRKRECNIDNYNSGDIKHEKQLLFQG